MLTHIIRIKLDCQHENLQSIGIYSRFATFLTLGLFPTKMPSLTSYV